MAAALLILALLAQNPPADDLARQGIQLQQSGDLEGAVKKYREFLKIHPDANPIRSNFGVALANLGRFDEAIVEYREALKREPANNPIALNLALAYYKTGRIPEAAAEFSKLHVRAPDEKQVTLLLADCQLRMGRNVDVIETLKPLDSSDLAVAYMLGMAYIHNDQVAEGQRLIDRILRNGESAEACLMLGSAKLGAKDFAGAREEFAKAAALNPKLPQVHGLYGLTLLSTGDPAAALTEFRAGLASDPNDFDSNLEIAVILRQDQNYDEAMPYLQKALRVRPGDFGVRYQIAAILFAENKVDESRKELESIVRQSPQFTEAHVTLATVYYRLKRKEDGDRERALVRKLTAAAQAQQPAAKVQ